MTSSKLEIQKKQDRIKKDTKKENQNITYMQIFYYYMHVRSSSPKTGSEVLTENSMFFLS